MDEQTPEPTPVPSAPAAAVAPAAPAAPGRRRRLGLGIGVTAGALVVGLVGGAAFGAAAAPAPAATEQLTITPAIDPRTTLPDSGTGTSQTDSTAASDEQQVGVVTIATDLYYGQGEAAGTGMVLTAEGVVLTNNHVIQGSTSIEVTIESTGETYTAEVLGTDDGADVAVLQLVDADGDEPTGLDTVAVDADTAAAVGDAVTAIGNAEGTGDLVAATGTVTAVDQSIQVADELTGEAESLTGLLELDADVVSGDSGGPLLDADGEVIGITTAASSGSADITGFAIPIGTALDIATQILAGQASETVTLGLPAFLGVTIAGDAATGGVTIAEAIDGLPADAAGLAAGDTVTAVDGVVVADSAALSAAIAAHAPGDTVTLSVTTAAGVATTVTATLVGGPAD